MKFLLKENRDLAYFWRICAQFRYCELIFSSCLVWYSPRIHLGNRSDLCNRNPQCIGENPAKVISFMFQTGIIKMIVNLR